MSVFSPPKLHRQIDRCLRRDQHRLRRQLRNITPKSKSSSAGSDSGSDSGSGDWPKPEQLERLNAQIAESMAVVEQRDAQVPAPNYPEHLPVVQQREAIVAAIKAHQVVVVCADTGSGKTTQLPKLCLEAGRGRHGYIGHTQPRRIAARSVAQRIASELNTELGKAVGYKVRFSDQVSRESYIKLMTDGMLLSEIQSDSWLDAYDTLIVDEAHERSLNIDFLLGYLKRLLQKRRDLKLIITSATIDPQRFSQHFDNAPIIMAEGRSYPVEVRYEPLARDDDDSERDEKDALFEACESLAREGGGDILCFFPGERQIREQAEFINKRKQNSKALRQAEVLPLYARLSNADQQRIFKTSAQRRIILATNVAETSLTVPGIRYVVDTGTARISRYSVASKVQRLPIEKISQASANQRKGRCGREAPGICIRLYDEEDFNNRPEFTEPEILRTNLASVILRMAALNLGSVSAFPFVQPPEQRFINDGYKLLFELGAVDEKQQLTSQGKVLARLPVDPKLGRMLLQAKDEGALDQVLTLVAVLSIQDPRERPQEQRQAADEQHNEFHDEQSDFTALLNLWAFYQVQAKRLSQSQLRKMCRQRFLNYLRMREWRDMRQQLSDQLKGMDWRWSSQDTSYESLHRSLLSGLLGNIAVKHENEYLGARNRRLRVAPGTPLAKKGPKWLMAAEMVETSKLFARMVAGIELEWVEQLAQHLIKRSHFDPRWHQKRAQVGAYEKGMLYGLVIYPKKRVNYGPLEPVVSREIFIRSALVEGQFQTKLGFYAHNQDLLNDIELLENKSRRRDILISPEDLYDFYDGLIPEGIFSGPQFESWYKKLDQSAQSSLYFSQEQLMQREADEITDRDFPPQMAFADLLLPLSYHFSPGSEDDGVTLSVPLGLLNRVSEARCSYLVPGLLLEKVTALIKSLPKSLRKNFVPAPDFAKACLEHLSPSDAPLLDALGHTLQRMTGVAVPLDQWSPDQLPLHLKMRFLLLDAKGKPLESSRSLRQLQRQFDARIQQSLSHHASSDFERDNLGDWNFGDLPKTVEIEQSGVQLHGFPALVFAQDCVHLRVLASRAEAQAAHRLGVHALYKLLLKDELRYLRRKLPHAAQIVLMFAPFGSKERITDDIIDTAIERVFVAPFALPTTREAFYAPLNAHRSELVAAANQLAEQALDALSAHRDVARRIKKNLPLSLIEPVADIKDQVQQLFYPGFVQQTPAQALKRLPVYFKAIERRLESAEHKPDKDRRCRAELLPLWERFKALPAVKVSGSDYDIEKQATRWQIEELRVSLFAQELGAQGKVSVARLEKTLEQLKKRAAEERVGSA